MSYGTHNHHARYITRIVVKEDDKEYIQKICEDDGIMFEEHEITMEQK